MKTTGVAPSHVPLLHQDTQAPGDAGEFEYHERLSLGRPSPWRGGVALLLLVAGFIAFSNVTFNGVGYLVTTFGLEMRFSGTLSPIVLGVAGLNLAFLVPWSMLVQKWLFGVPGRSLHSVAGRFRWRLLFRAAVIIVPVWSIYTVVWNALEPSPIVDYPVAELVAFAAVSLLILPLQSAGEEYAFRGLTTRVVASWCGGRRRLGLVLGICISSVLFAASHLAADPWLNLNYLVMGIAFGIITWRTGGLEVAVLLHVANNVLWGLGTVATSSDFGAGFDRSDGAGSAMILVSIALMTVVTAVVWRRTPTTRSLTSALAQ